jgi:predicted metal-dependent enzyme (double-stranded beta helix superfamily)
MPAPHFDRRHITSPLIWSRRDRRVLRAMADFVQACDATHDQKVRALLQMESPNSRWLLRRLRQDDDDA